MSGRYFSVDVNCSLDSLLSAVGSVENSGYCLPLPPLKIRPCSLLPVPGGFHLGGGFSEWGDIVQDAQMHPIRVSSCTALYLRGSGIPALGFIQVPAKMRSGAHLLEAKL